MMKRLVLFLSLFVFIMIPKDVLALTTDTWLADMKDSSISVLYRGCGGSDASTCTMSKNIHAESGRFHQQLAPIDDSDIFYRNYYVADSVGFDSSGHSWIIELNQKLKQNYLYNVRFYVCSSNSNFYNRATNYNFWISLGLNPYTTEPLDYWYSKASISTPIIDSEREFSSCALYSGLLVPNVTGQYVSLRLRNSGSTIQESEYLMGVEVEPMGVFSYNTLSGTINTAIQNSGFATASSVNDIQTSVNQVKTEINGMEQQQQQTNQKLENVNNSLNSEEAPTNNDVSNKTSEWSSKLAGTGPVSQMVLMPITLLNGYVNGMNATCTPYNLGNLMGTDIILPCINISNYLGSSLWSVIDVLFSGFMIFVIGKKFVKIFNDFTNLRDNQMDELYGGGK